MFEELHLLSDSVLEEQNLPALPSWAESVLLQQAQTIASPLQECRTHLLKVCKWSVVTFRVVGSQIERRSERRRVSRGRGSRVGND